MAAALPFLVFVSGIALMLYPTVSDWWNSLHQTRAIRAYTEKVAELESGEYEPFWKEATEYNQNLSSGAYLKKMTEEEQTEYERLLNVTGNGMMGYVEIPSINCLLPVYHGTDEAVLQIAVGHIAGTALPVGGEGTHCVLSSHRGLPSARLFTDLDQLEEGDTFRLHILDGVLTYQVDRILTVEPDETEALAPEEGKDYCTLVHALRSKHASAPGKRGSGTGTGGNRNARLRRNGNEVDIGGIFADNPDFGGAVGRYTSLFSARKERQEKRETTETVRKIEMKEASCDEWTKMFSGIPPDIGGNPVRLVLKSERPAEYSAGIRARNRGGRARKNRVVPDRLFRDGAGRLSGRGISAVSGGGHGSFARGIHADRSL